MSWSYDPTALETALYQVRLIIGDTDENDPQLQDEEIQLFIDSTASVESAARSALQALAARYARQVDKWVGDLKILASQRHRAILSQLEDIDTTIRTLGIPSAGGIRYSQKEEIEGDTDLVVPSFRRGQFDYGDEPS